MTPSGPGAPARRALLTPRSSAILAQKGGRAIEFLLARGILPVLYWLKKDILSVPAERELRNLEKYADRVRVLESQAPDGGWRLKKTAAPMPGSSSSRVLLAVENGSKLCDYGCGPEDEAVRAASGFLLAHSSRDGIFGDTADRTLSLDGQALCFTLLCRLGFDDEARVRKGLRRLVQAQNADGGWSPSSGRAARRSSPAVTGLVLGALAESPTWRTSREARRAGEWLVGLFFRESRGSAGSDRFRWSEIAYPFWKTNILGCIDALSRIGFRPEEKKVRLSLEWLIRRQQPAGQWESRRDKATLDDHLWVTLAVLRVLKRFGLIAP